MKERPWVVSKWAAEDLDGREVYFNFTVPSHEREGIGKLKARSLGGKLCVSVCMAAGEMPLDQRAMDALRREADGFELVLMEKPGIS
jgi:hypothetical protein